MHHLVDFPEREHALTDVKLRTGDEFLAGDSRAPAAQLRSEPYIQ